VRPDRAASWLGIFYPILTSARDTNAVVALPDGETFAVVSHGSVYRAWVEAPERWEEIAPGGVHEPVIARDLELVAFVDHTVLTAYGVHGLAWKSERLVWDDVNDPGKFGPDGGVEHFLQTADLDLADQERIAAGNWDALAAGIRR
jgi:hypothetical protein